MSLQHHDIRIPSVWGQQPLSTIPDTHYRQQWVGHRAIYVSMLYITHLVDSGFTVFGIFWRPIACCVRLLLLVILAASDSCCFWFLLPLILATSGLTDTIELNIQGDIFVAPLAASGWTNRCLDNCYVPANDALDEASVNRHDSELPSPGWGMCVGWYGGVE